jgi:site-specific DNA-methyltransferase (adenine-specific)
MQTATAIQNQPTVNSVVHGDCIEVMRTMSAASIDFVLTDPPYLVSYRDRAGRTIQNDQNDAWMRPAFREIYRVLKPNRFFICFYGWSRVDRFMSAWRVAGFRVVGHMVFVKRYASASKFLRYQHEQAYLLAKGSPEFPAKAIGDVIEMRYSGNRFHPTQKPVSALLPLIQSFSNEGDLVLDPFCGSGSTLVAAQVAGRAYLGIELEETYCNIARDRMQRRAAKKQPTDSFPPVADYARRAACVKAC